MVTDVIAATDQRLQALRPRSPDEVRDHPHPLVGFSDEMAAKVRELKAFLYRRLYRHPHVVRMQAKAERTLEALFRAYIQEPEQLPYWVQERIREEGDLHRVVCDYIAGMTDRFALGEYRRLYEVTDVL
jgi:dGTPase